jgi:predicted Rossmann fold flavoprotein
MYDLVIVGGGAAGFYAAASLREQLPAAKILILERGGEFLTKVKVSGGGRCNVTHSEFDARELTTHYPRGQKELLGPFYHYGPAETLAFFERFGVELKTEEDGRIFPVSDRSQTIIDCLMNSARGPSTEWRTKSPVQSVVQKPKSGLWTVVLKEETLETRLVLIATGSNPKMWKMLASLGHRIVPPVPSLFTFRIQDALLQGLQGISLNVALRIDTKHPKFPNTLESSGPLLITHRGLSGPAILRLSAWGALVLNSLNYNFELEVNWLPEFERASLEQYLQQLRAEQAKKKLINTAFAQLPKRLWQRFCEQLGLEDTRWADCKRSQLNVLIEHLLSSRFQVRGKDTFKEEFVTAGGIDLRDVDFRAFESKKCPGLFFAGEVLNIDAITGGFNFQNAWTGAHIAAQRIAERLRD